jgi:hypothetical protein
MTEAITLTPDQQTALDAFSQFLLDPIETVFVLSGYSGTGKSTLIKTILDKIPDYMRTARLINPKVKDYTVQLTATTNKAAENFSQITGMEVSTIHSFLGLRVQTDYVTNTTRLIPRSADEKFGYLLFIDEASYVDKDLLKYVFSLTKQCKIVFIGDPAQLTPVKATATPVFDAKFSGAHLSQVVRQAEGNPIINLSTMFRNTVNTGEFFKFSPDGQVVVYLDRVDFNQSIESEFTRPDWKYQDSKILAWTNKRVIDYNHSVRDCVKGNPHFQVGDYAVCNKFVSQNRTTIKTDQMVRITDISEPQIIYGVPGRYYELDNHLQIFGPDSLDEKKLAIKNARACEEFGRVQDMENWIDLRAAYACTVNKAQGSTFDRVFIDLDDISRCNSGNQIARMLYVAVSRARKQVFLTGDLV